MPRYEVWIPASLLVPPSGTILFDGDVGALAAADPVTPSAWNSVWSTGNNNMAYFDDTAIYADAARGKVARVWLDANAINGDPAGNHCSVFYSSLPGGPVESATLEYSIRFTGTSHNLGWGGKLPGLMGILPGGDLARPSGGKGASDVAWAGRLMWLTNPPYPGSVPAGQNRVIPYIYSAYQAGAYGENVWTDTPAQITRDAWHHVRVDYIMNSVSGGVGNPDGALRMWWDGVKVLDRSSFRYRSNAALGISHVSWAIFRGGGTLDWAVPTREPIDVDNLRVTTL